MSDKSKNKEKFRNALKQFPKAVLIEYIVMNLFSRGRHRNVVADLKGIHWELDFENLSIQVLKLETEREKHSKESLEYWELTKSICTLYDKNNRLWEKYYGKNYEGKED